MAGVTRRHRLWKVNAPRSRMLLLAVAAAVVLFLAGSVVNAQFGQQEAETQQETAEQQRDATAEQARTLAEQIQAACASGDLTGPVCQQAAEVAATPVPEPVGPTEEQIRAAVEDYLAEYPPADGRNPTVAELAAAAAAAVTEYLTAHPPSPGRSPTAGEIAAAVEMYFATNPPPPGPEGATGRPPTSEEIRAAVDAYLSENPPPPGPAGATGATGPQGVQGVGVQSVRAEERDDGCVLVFVLADPADGSTSEVVVPVPDRVCRDGLLGG